MQSPLMREAALWFGVGGAVAAFVFGAVLALAALVGAGSTARLTRAVGSTVDKLLVGESTVVAAPPHYSAVSPHSRHC